MKYTSFQVYLRPIVSVNKEYCDYNGLNEFPWQPFHNKLISEYNREIIGIFTLDGDNFVGAMAIDYSKKVPELIFFEIKSTYRGRGWGRVSLFLLIRKLITEGYDKLFVQTGRPEIYTKMGFKFKIIERRGILIDLYDYDGGRIPNGIEAPLTIVYTEKYLFHNFPNHPDNTLRVSQTLQLLQTRRIMEFLNIIPPREASIDELLLVHSINHIENIKNASKKGLMAGPNAPTIENTYECALLAYGGAMVAAENVEKYKRIFVLSRPPGHHATQDQAKGFCFFNNMAGLAIKLFNKGYRPLIIDWDIHHGDGTQKLLYDKPIMFVSIHQAYLYPFTGRPDEIGIGAGKGYTRNLLVPPLATDEEYLAIFEQVRDIAEEYKPDIILVSAGQDGLKEDKLSGTLLTPNCYFEMARIVRELADKFADGKLILLLEGGYALEKLAEANLQIILGIAGNELQEITTNIPKRNSTYNAQKFKNFS